MQYSLKHSGRADIYSRGVFVCQDFNLIPPGVDFVKGIIESPDFSLMINRQGVVSDNTSYGLIQKVIRETVLRHLIELRRSLDSIDNQRFQFIG